MENIRKLTRVNCIGRFDFYTMDGAVALAQCLRNWPGGRLVVSVAEMPIKCPVAPHPGAYPLPGVGPFPLLKESVINHWGKLFLRWLYWNMLLPGRMG